MKHPFTLLDRYIATTVLAAIALVTLMLVGLQLFILFVNQLGDLGHADYGILEAIKFVLLEMPYEVYLFFPMASLLGCLIGLGTLANHCELVVMRASGMSVGQVTAAVLKVAIILITVVTFVGEVVVPRLVSLAQDQKAQALSGGQTLRTAQGVWFRYHNDFIVIGSTLLDNTLQNVQQFHFDKTHRLTFSRTIKTIHYVNGAWQAYDVSETVIDANTTSTRTQNKMQWDVALKPSVLSVSRHEPDEMTLYELHQYLHAQKISHQTAQQVQLVYWQRLIQPLTTVVMMVLAIPFIFGPLRSSTMGSKLLAGAAVGFGFYIINRFLGSVSQVYQLSSIMAAIGPTCLFALLGLYLMRRIK